MDISPEGDPSSSPGLRYSATLGKMASEFPNPNGVVAKPARPRTPTRRIAFDVGHCGNPVGVARIVAAIPKVAEYSNLGLWASTTTWLKTNFSLSLAYRWIPNTRQTKVCWTFF